MTGLSRTTVSSVVTELKQQGLVEATMLTSSTTRGGRPGIGLGLKLRTASKGDQVGRPNDLIRDNAKLVAENMRLKSILGSIEELVVGRTSGDSATS
jgi:DNA-binding transcriptional regulator LsrR (DeoR family)